MKEETYDISIKGMDTDTVKLFDIWWEEYSKENKTSYPHPLILIMYACNKYFNTKNDYRESYYAYTSQGSVGYGELYKILSYKMYGFGNWSNNDRRRKGMHALRDNIK